LGNLETPENIQKLQTALHAKAKGEPGFRFYSCSAEMGNSRLSGEPAF
jgi:hypothetical protein